MAAKLPPHGEGGGQKKTGRVPLSTHSPHDGQGKEAGGYATPDALHVKYFHRFADTDAGEQSLHHTLGASSGQASPGDHKHDGGSSPYLIDAYSATGQRPTNGSGTDTTWAKSVEAALAALGLNIASTD